MADNHVRLGRQQSGSGRAALTVSTDRIGQEARKSKRHSPSTRQELRDRSYHFVGTAGDEELSITPLVGLGKSSLLNKTIFHLMPCAEHKLDDLHPYFNLPAVLVRNIIQLAARRKTGGDYCRR